MGLVGLHSAMNKLARDVWDDFADADVLGAILYEPGVTDRLLLNLRRHLRGDGLPLRVVQVSSGRENEIGADLELWLALEDGRFFGYSIQSKRCVARGVRQDIIDYPSLDHEVGPADAREQQFDVLIRESQRRGAHPVHLFYNGWAATRAGDRVPYPPSTRMEKARPYFGCAALSTHHVRRLFASASKPSERLGAVLYAPWTVPWSHLFLVNGWMGTGVPIGEWGWSRPEPGAMYFPRSSGVGFRTDDITVLARQYLAVSAAVDRREVASTGVMFAPEGDGDHGLFAEELPADVLSALRTNDRARGGETPLDPLLPVGRSDGTPRYAVVIGHLDSSSVWAGR